MSRLLNMDNPDVVSEYYSLPISSLPGDEICLVAFKLETLENLINESWNQFKQKGVVFYKITNGNYEFVIYFPKNPLYCRHIAAYVIRNFIDKEQLPIEKWLRLISCYDNKEMLDKLNKLMEKNKIGAEETC